MSVYSNNDMDNIKSNDSWFKINKFVPSDARILDVGCSSGNLGKYLRKSKKAYVVGVDIDAEDVELAKKVLNEAHRIDLEKDDLTSLGVFDVIIMADVIEHLVDPVSVLKKLKPLLTKNGRFIFSVPNMANATIRLEILKGTFEYKDFGLLDRTHLHFYDNNELDRVFRDAGFTVTDMDCTVRTIPDEILKKELADIGIAVTDDFKKHLESSEASTFQFIGYATVNTRRQNKSKMTLSTSTSLDVITKEIEMIRSNYDARIMEMDAAIKHTEHEKAVLSKSLNEIYNSKGWKALSQVYGFKKHFSKK